MGNAKDPEVAEWNSKFERCVKMRQPFEQQWILNMAFYGGKQYVMWSKANLSPSLIEPPANPQTVRAVSNKIKPIIRREMSKLSKEEPQFYITPATTEPEDVAAAIVGESLADYSLKSSSFNAIRRQATFWNSMTGIGVFKTYCPGPDMDVIYEAIPSFHFYVPYLHEPTIKAQPFVFHARGLNPDYVQELYDVKVKPDINSKNSILEQRFLSSIGVNSGSSDASKDCVFVKEVWVKKSAHYPNGALLVIVGDEIIYSYDSGLPGTNSAMYRGPEPQDMPLAPTEEDPDNKYELTYGLPYEHGEYPFAKMGHIPTGSFYPDSVIKDLIPLQKLYNRSRSQVMEVKNLTSNPMLAYMKGSIDPTKITNRPGLQIPVQPGFTPPAYIQPPSLPPYHSEDENTILRDMDDTANQFEVTKGRTPPGVEAASAIAYLQEENDNVLHETVASMEEALESIGFQTLMLIKQFWSLDRIINVVSKNNAMEAQIFQMSSFVKNVDLKVEPGSMAPKSRAAKQAFITGLIKDGIIPPDRGLQYLQMNETDKLYEEMQIDIKQADRENYKLVNGAQLPINDYDNDEVHLSRHDKFFKSQQFEALPDDIKIIALTHRALHNDRIMQRQLMMENANAVGGNGPDQAGQ